MDLDIDDKFQLLDAIGMPKNNNLLFSSLNDILIYSIGSNIIIYNLKKNIKTFLQNYYTDEICTFKFLDKKEQLLLIINKGPHPLLSIWKLPFLEEIYSKEIFNENNNINFKEIFIEKIFSNLFIIIITAIDCNFLYNTKIISILPLKKYVKYPMFIRQSRDLNVFMMIYISYSY